MHATVKIDSIIKHYPSVYKKYTIDGLNFISNANASENAAGFIRLKSYKERGDVKDASQLSLSMMQAVSSVKDANTFFFTFPTIQGFGNVSGFEFMLEDRGNHSLAELGKTAYAFSVH